MGPKLRGLILLPEFRLLAKVIHHEYESNCQGRGISVSFVRRRHWQRSLEQCAIDAFVKTILNLVLGNVALISESQI